MPSILNYSACCAKERYADTTDQETVQYSAVRVREVLMPVTDLNYL